MRLRSHVILFVIVAATMFVPTVASADEVFHRVADQEQQITNDLQNGQLTPSEAHMLQRRELATTAQEVRDLHNNDGQLTSPESSQLNHQLNHVEHAIRLDTATPSNEVRLRQSYQESRILARLQAGKITPSAFRQLENRELNVAAQRAQDLQSHAGQLTTQESQQLNQELDSLSRSIVRDR
jgi:hypothetical protein